MTYNIIYNIGLIFLHVLDVLMKPRRKSIYYMLNCSFISYTILLYQHYTILLNNCNINLPQSLYQNSGSFLFLLARAKVFSTKSTNKASFVISQAHIHILKYIC